MDQRALVKIRC